LSALSDAAAAAAEPLSSPATGPCTGPSAAPEAEPAEPDEEDEDVVPPSAVIAPARDVAPPRPRPVAFALMIAARAGKDQRPAKQTKEGKNGTSELSGDTPRISASLMPFDSELQHGNTAKLSVTTAIKVASSRASKPGTAAAAAARGAEASERALLPDLQILLQTRNARARTNHQLHCRKRNTND
jgi:hypothetical protein